jgi:hypothetical protein
MSIEDEIIFCIEAKKKATQAGKAQDYMNRLNTLFLEGQVSETAYKMMLQIYEAENPKPAKQTSTKKTEPVPKIIKMPVNNDPCSRGSVRSNGC